MNIISRYILREIIPNYVIGLGFLSVILLVAQIFQMVRLVVEKNIPVDKVIIQLVLYIPLILQLTLPVAVIVGTLLAMGRLSSDSEIIAMRSCGLSLQRVFVPSIVFGIVLSIFTLLFYEYVVPFSTLKYIEAKKSIYQINPTAELSKSLSYNTIDNVKITVDFIDSNTNELTNVRIYYDNENKIIFAPKGLLLAKDFEKNAFPLILFHSTMQPANIFQPNIDKRFDEEHNLQQTIYIPDRESDQILPTGHQTQSLTDFYKQIKQKKFNIALNVIRANNRLVSFEREYIVKKGFFEEFVKNNTEPADPEEKKNYINKFYKLKRGYAKAHINYLKYKTLVEQRYTSEGQIVKAVKQDEYDFHRKIVLAFSAFAFGILGAPLGIFSKRAGKSLGLGVSILIIVAYFIMIFVGQYLMKKEILNPLISNWYSNIILFIIGSYYIYQRLRGN